VSAPDGVRPASLRSQGLRWGCSAAWWVSAGVAGGEMLVPVITVLFAVDVKLAGSLSLIMSLPTMLVGFARYSRSQAFSVLRDNGRFVSGWRSGRWRGP
jgi:uncharacterized protein